MAQLAKVLAELNVYANPAKMKRLYGIAITEQQAALARRTIKYYKALDSKTLAAMSDEEAVRWPYRLTDEQRLDAVMHTEPPNFTIPQSVIWREVRKLLAGNAGKYPDVPAIVQAIKDMEGFMQLNMYLGEFQENNDLMTNTDGKLLQLFAMAYANHATG